MCGNVLMLGSIPEFHSMFFLEFLSHLCIVQCLKFFGYGMVCWKIHRRLFTRLDQAVYKYFLNVQSRNIPVNGPMLKEKAMSYAR